MEHDQEFLGNILKEQKVNISIPNKIYNKNIKYAVTCIRNNLFNRELTVSRLKKKCGISDGSFATKFAKATGQYPKDFILSHRIEAAKQLLKETNATITLIAISIGFNSLSAFCKTFKNRESINPSEWRSS